MTEGPKKQRKSHIDWHVLSLPKVFFFQHLIAVAQGVMMLYKQELQLWKFLADLQTAKVQQGKVYAQAERKINTFFGRLPNVTAFYYVPCALKRHLKRYVWNCHKTEVKQKRGHWEKESKYEREVEVWGVDIGLHFSWNNRTIHPQ